MSIEWSDQQRRAIELIVSARLRAEHRLHRKEWDARESVLQAEIEKLRLELRAERSVLARIRDWLSSVVTNTN